MWCHDIWCGESLFFSIQPFWEPELAFDWLVGLGGSPSVSLFRWGKGEMESVAGNGQVGIILQGPEDWKGVCYGVVDAKATIPLFGLYIKMVVKIQMDTPDQILLLYNRKQGMTGDKGISK